MRPEVEANRLYPTPMGEFEMVALKKKSERRKEKPKMNRKGQNKGPKG